MPIVCSISCLCVMFANKTLINLMPLYQVQWLQRNDLTRLDYDARYAAELSNLMD